MARAILSSEIGDEGTATRVLEAAFDGDPRLDYARGRWRLVYRPAPDGAPEPGGEPERALLLLDGARPDRGKPFVLRSIAVIRLGGERVVSACAGDLVPGADPSELRSGVREALEGAIPVVHDPPGALAALERWLDEPLDAPVSLRRLAHRRLGLPSDHSLEALAARLGLAWRETGDPIDSAEALEACLQALRGPRESLATLREACRTGSPPVPWRRYAFDRAFLREIPATPGTYRFFDEAGRLLYVGKSANLRRRVGSYFREGLTRTARVQALLDSLHRVEIEPTGSDLEAVLREAAAIAKRRPERNVQRRHHPRAGRPDRLGSILVLEPAWPPHALRAFLIRDGSLLERVFVGPRGGGLRRIERILEERFFDPRPGPSTRRPTPVDLELVARWLATHRDRAVAFDPTHLRNAREVVLRLRWFLETGALRDPDGAPTVPR